MIPSFPVPSMQVSDVFLGSGFKVFADTMENGGVIKALCVPGGATVFSNTDLKKGTVYTEASKAGAKGLPFLKVMENGKMEKKKLRSSVRHYVSLHAQLFYI